MAKALFTGTAWVDNPAAEQASDARAQYSDSTGNVCYPTVFSGNDR